jgi:hypothetical protein
MSSAIDTVQWLQPDAALFALGALHDVSGGR